MVSLYYGYEYYYFKETDEKDIRPWLMAVVVATTIVSSVGAVKALSSQLRTSLGFYN